MNKVVQIANYLSDIFNKSRKQTVYIAVSITLLLLTYQSIQFIAMIQRTAPGAILQRNVTPYSETTKADLYNTIDTVLQQNLLGQVPQSPAIEEGEARFRVRSPLPEDALLQQAPQTKLNIQLVGLISSRDQNLAIVIVEQNGLQDSYFVGNQIKDQPATVVKMLPDRVVLDERGYYTSLLMN